MEDLVTEHVQEIRRWPLWATAVALAVVALVTWGVLHPDFRPDPQLVSPALLEELGKTGFKATQGVASARFESVQQQDGFSADFSSRQEIVPINGLITEKRSRRYTKGQTREFSGLYVGPITVVRYERVWPPLFGDLLPYHFWRSTRMSALVVEQAVDFPHEMGGKLVANITYENHHGDGEPARTERVRLRCDVKSVVDAVSVNTRFSGVAARIDCMELVEPDPGAVSSSSGDSDVPDYTKYSHWYIVDRGWSISIEGEQGFRIGDSAVVQTWRSKLVSFE